MITQVLEALFNLNDLGFAEVVAKYKDYGWKLDLASPDRMVFTDGIGNCILVWVWHDRTGGRGKRATHTVERAAWTLNSPNYPHAAVGIMKGDTPEELDQAIHKFELHKDTIMTALNKWNKP